MTDPRGEALQRYTPGCSDGFTGPRATMTTTVDGQWVKWDDVVTLLSATAATSANARAVAWIVDSQHSGDVNEHDLFWTEGDAMAFAVNNEGVVVPLVRAAPLSETAPSGTAKVPVEHTMLMRHHFWRAYHSSAKQDHVLFQDAYRAMLAAAPSPDGNSRPEQDNRTLGDIAADLESPDAYNAD